jgi:hypothetical protein
VFFFIFWKKKHAKLLWMIASHFGYQKKNSKKKDTLSGAWVLDWEGHRTCDPPDNQIPTSKQISEVRLSCWVGRWRQGPSYSPFVLAFETLIWERANHPWGQPNLLSAYMISGTVYTQSSRFVKHPSWFSCVDEACCRSHFFVHMHNLDLPNGYECNFGHHHLPYYLGSFDTKPYHFHKCWSFHPQ